MTDFNLVLSQVRQRLEILYQIVDELEAQGGGGGQGGTDNYNELTNKPKINNITLSGNKTGEDLGLADYAALADKADKSTTYTKTQVDGLLDDKADKSTTYTKTEVDTALSGKADAATTYTKTETNAEITGAIMDLDVPNVGADDGSKYIGLVGQADGSITATAFTPALNIVANISKPPTTDAVNSAINNAKTAANSYTDTAVANKIGLADVFGQGVRIQGSSAQHEDLDNYYTAGNYYILTAGDAGNTDNKPYDPDFDVASVRARVLVFQFSGTTSTDARCFQIYIPARTNSSTGSNVMYMRYRYISSGAGAWTAWYAIGGTALGPAPALQMVNAEMRTAVEPDEDEPQDER